MKLYDSIQAITINKLSLKRYYAIIRSVTQSTRLEIAHNLYSEKYHFLVKVRAKLNESDCQQKMMIKSMKNIATRIQNCKDAKQENCSQKYIHINNIDRESFVSKLD